MMPENSQTRLRENPEEIQRMFNAIAPTYDTLNHVLSLGLDIRWRRRAIKLLESKRGGTFLDIAAGSGDVSIDLRSLEPRNVIASDFALNMLEVFRQKLSRIVHRGKIDLVSSDALALPFRDASFDATIVAFGIRNFSDRLRALSEMMRVLKPDGISVILELTAPTMPVVSQLYHAYSRWGLPIIGKIISNNDSAYEYLPSSISQFPHPQEFLALLSAAGFSSPTCLPLSFGIATIYSGIKGATPPA